MQSRYCPGVEGEGWIATSKLRLSRQTGECAQEGHSGSTVGAHDQINWQGFGQGARNMKYCSSTELEG